MPRVKRGVIHVKHRKNLLKRAKGFKLGRKNKIRLAKTAVMKAGKRAYVVRKQKKRDFRGLWQIIISAAAKENGLSYSKLIGLLRKNKIGLDRKILADLAENHSVVFNKIVASLKK